jgi:hypothetical protein
VNAVNGVFDDDYEEKQYLPDAIAALAGSL